MSDTAAGHSAFFSVDTSEVLLVALYLRDHAGLAGAGRPALPPVVPVVRAIDVCRLVEPVGGSTTLRVEWEAWWHGLISHRIGGAVLPVPPHFNALDGMEALKALLRAHFGAAMEWARERCADYALRTGSRGAESVDRVLTSMLRERELELGRMSHRFSLELIELPLAARRAWWIEPDKLVLSQDLFDDERSFRSYVEPVIGMLA